MTVLGNALMCYGELHIQLAFYSLQTYIKIDADLLRNLGKFQTCINGNTLDNNAQVPLLVDTTDLLSMKHVTMK